MQRSRKELKSGHYLIPLNGPGQKSCRVIPILFAAVFCSLDTNHNQIGLTCADSVSAGTNTSRSDAAYVNSSHAPMPSLLYPRDSIAITINIIFPFFVSTLYY